MARERLTPEEAIEDVEQFDKAADKYGLPNMHELNSSSDVKDLGQMLEEEGVYTPVKHYEPTMNEWPEVGQFIAELQLDQESAAIVYELCRPEFDTNMIIGLSHNLFNSDMDIGPKGALLYLDPMIEDRQKRLAEGASDEQRSATISAELRYCQLLKHFYELNNASRSFRMVRFFEKIKSRNYERP